MLYLYPHPLSNRAVCALQVDASMEEEVSMGVKCYTLLCLDPLSSSVAMISRANNSARDSETNQKVAIKKISNAFENLVDAKRTLREIKLVRHLNHENVVQIMDLIPPMVH
eukprot:scaffold49389_cov19-Tisochrysis_lutea.AAC.2